MLVHERQRRILKRLRDQPQSKVSDLQRELNVSRSTVRRDLLELEGRGDIVRVHGGVVHPDYLRGEPTLDYRRTQARTAKRAIAAAAARLVPDNAAVFLDAGSTCLELGRLLCLREDVRIFTHSVPLLMECGSARAAMTCVGGEYRRAGQALVGSLALSWLERMHFDLVFIGASGLDEHGPSTTELSEGSIKSALLGRAQRSVLVAGMDKWNSPAAIRFAPWSAFGSWVCDSPVPSAAQSRAESAGVELVVAEQEAPVAAGSPADVVHAQPR